MMNNRNETRFASPAMPETSRARGGGPANLRKWADPNEIPPIDRSVRLIRVPSFGVGGDRPAVRPRLDMNLACRGLIPAASAFLIDPHWIQFNSLGEEGWGEDNETL